SIRLPRAMTQTTTGPTLVAPSRSEFPQISSAYSLSTTSSSLFVIVFVVVVVAHLGGIVVGEILAQVTLGRDLFRASGELQDVHAGAVAVDDVDIAAVVDLDVVRHVAVGVRECVRDRHVERDFPRRLRLANVANPYAAVEIRERGELAVVRIAEVLLAR